MARGNKIVVTADAKGHHDWGYLGGAYKPGTIVQKNFSVALKHGDYTWTVYTRGADGDRPAGAYAIVDYDPYQGQTADTAFASGDFVPLYHPLPGDELNLLFLNQAGTADDVAIGTLMIADNGTGKITPTTGSPESECAISKEALTDPTADQLLWVEWTGL